MKFTGKLQNIFKDWITGKYHVTFSVDEQEAVRYMSDLKEDKLSIEAKKYKEIRSNAANRMLWACLGDLAKSQTPPISNWEMYLKMLKEYGKYTYICVKPNVVDAVKLQWRETEVIGEIDINGQTAIQMLCYFGTSTYDTKEFSKLLEGVIHEMKQLNLQPPPSKEMRAVLEQWEKDYQKRMKNNEISVA